MTAAAAAAVMVRLARLVAHRGAFRTAIGKGVESLLIYYYTRLSLGQKPIVVIMGKRRIMRRTFIHSFLLRAYLLARDNSF